MYSEDKWVLKCKQCKHIYQTKDEADEIKCRLKICRYEPYEPKNQKKEKTDEN